MDNSNLPEKFVKHRLYRRTHELAQNDMVDWEQIRATLRETADLLETEQIPPAIRASVLQRRAEQVAQAPTEETAAQDHIAVVLVKLAQERYAVPVSAMRAVSEFKRLTPVPCVPPYYCGVTNLGGKIMSVLDLLAFFGVADDTPVPSSRPRMLIVVAGAGLEIALLVDEVEAVTELPRLSLIASQALGQEWLENVSAVTAEGVVLLDIEQLFRDPRIRIYEEPR